MALGFPPSIAVSARHAPAASTELVGAAVLWLGANHTVSLIKEG